MVKTPRAKADGNRSRDGVPDDGTSLYCLSYVSTQSHPMDNDALLSLLTHARERNESLGITGLLLHREDSFFQVLEGGREDVLAVFADIDKDSRHQRIEVVTEGYVGEREYADWQMAFIELEGQDFSALPGFSDILKDTPAAREFLRTLSRSKKLALLFTVMD